MLLKLLTVDTRSMISIRMTKLGAQKLQFSQSDACQQYPIHVLQGQDKIINTDKNTAI